MKFITSSSPSAYARRLYSTIAILALLILSLLWTSIEQRVQERNHRGQLYVRIIESTVSRTFEALETTLYSLADDINALPLTQTRLKLLRERVQQTLSFAPQLRQIAVIHQNETRLNTRNNRSAPLDLATLQLGNYANRTHSQGLEFGRLQAGRFLPEQSEKTGDNTRNFIPVSLQTTDSSGEPILIVAALNPGYFTRFIDNLPLTAQDQILLTDFSGSTLLETDYIDTDYTLSKTLEQLISSSAREMSTNITTAVSNPLSISISLSDKYPLAVSAIVCHRDTFTLWLISYRNLLLGLLLLFATLLTGAFFAVRVKRRSFELQQKNTLLSQVVEDAPTMILITDREGIISYVNPSFEEQTQYSLKESIGRTPSFLKADQQSAQTYRDMWLQISVGNSWHGEFCNRRKDGSIYWERASVSPLTNSQGNITHYIALKESISEEKAALEKIRLASTVFDTSIEAIMVTDAKGQIQMVNHAFEKITGYSSQEVIGASPALLKSGRHDTEFYTQLYTTLGTEHDWQGEIWNCRKNGEIYPQWLVISSRFDQEGKLEGYVALFSDITKRKENEAMIAHQAHYDKLTGLPNRTLFADKLEEALKNHSHNHEKVALLFIDLDRFKYVNDTYGHHIGDLLLLEVAQRLTQVVPLHSTVSRLGGDEFTVIVPKIDKLLILDQLARAILSTLAKPYLLESNEAHISCSIGIALYPDNACDSEQLIINADSAMYKAKHLGRNTHHFFNDDLNAQHSKRREMEKELHQAITREQFSLVFQPIYSTDGRLIKAAEALIRWRHSNGNVISPADFIPLCEESTLIHDVGHWVIEQSCRYASTLQDALEHAPKISINVSSLQFLKGDVDQHFASALRRHQLEGSALILELTESALMLDAKIIHNQLQGIVKLGIEIAIDDFGTGFSSLSYLKNLPISRLKIDKSFIDDIASNTESQALVQGILSLAQSLKLSATVEGVETLEQLDILRRHSRPLIQGYLYSKPLTGDALLKRLHLEGTSKNL